MEGRFSPGPLSLMVGYIDRKNALDETTASLALQAEAYATPHHAVARLLPLRRSVGRFDSIVIDYKDFLLEGS